MVKKKKFRVRKTKSKRVRKRRKVLNLHDEKKARDLMIGLDSAFISSIIMKNFFPAFAENFVHNLEIALGFAIILLLISFGFDTIFTHFFSKKDYELQIFILGIIFIIIVALFTLQVNIFGAYI